MRPIYFSRSKDHLQNQEIYEAQITPYSDYVQIKFQEALLNDVRWDVLGIYQDDDNRYTFLQRELAKCLEVDKRIPLGYLLEDYIEQCPYDLHCNQDFDYSTPEEFDLV
jgi:hypothetical protein